MRFIFLNQSSNNSFAIFYWILGIAIVVFLLWLWWFKRKIDTNDLNSTDYISEDIQPSNVIKAKKVTAPGITPVATSFVDGVAKVDDSVKDDLTKIEGIGPKIKGLLNDNGIWSYRQLADATIDRIQEILNNAGPRYRIHNPSTWPRQSELAAEGKWEDLKKWQTELKGARK